MGWYRSTEVSMDNQLKGYDDDDGWLYYNLTDGVAASATLR